MPEPKPLVVEGKIQRFNRLRTACEKERSPLMSTYRDIDTYVLPGRFRPYSGDISRGSRRNHQAIVDSTGSQAARTLRAGMMAGMTSPSREWKQLTTEDPGLAKWGPGRAWLGVVNDGITAIFRKCGVYGTLPKVYGDAGGFATGVMHVEEDLTGNALRTQSFAVGSYMIAVDDRGRLTAFIRVFQMTVRQVVSMFYDRAEGNPWSNISSHVKDLWMRGDYEVYVEICHVVTKNDAYDARRMQSKYKRFLSCYYETGVSKGTQQGYTSSNSDVFLSEKGYDFFPILGLRWETVDNDPYGSDCPGFLTIGDVKALQVREKVMARAEEKLVNPPLTGPAELEGRKVSTLPGDITYITEREGVKGLRPTHEVNYPLQHSESKQEQLRRRINSGWYVDMFLPIIRDERNERATAYEIASKKEERLIELWPVLENGNNDLLDPLIDIAFNIGMQQGLFPPPPRELQGQRIGVQYVSIMAQAQKALGLGGVERFLGIVGNAFGATADRRWIRKVNVDKTVEGIADMTGIPVEFVRTTEEVEAIEQAEAEAAAEQQQMEQIKTAADAAKSMSQAKTDEPSALTNLISAAKAGQVG